MWRLTPAGCSVDCPSDLEQHQAPKRTNSWNSINISTVVQNYYGRIKVRAALESVAGQNPAIFPNPANIQLRPNFCRRRGFVAWIWKSAQSMSNQWLIRTKSAAIVICLWLCFLLAYLVTELWLNVCICDAEKTATWNLNVSSEPFFSWSVVATEQIRLRLWLQLDLQLKYATKLCLYSNRWQIHDLLQSL